MAERLKGFFHAPEGQGPDGLGPDQPGTDPVRHHYYEAQTDDPNEPQIWAYTGRHAYSPGQALELHVSTTCPSYRVTVRRDGAGDDVVWASGNQPGTFHAVAADCSVAGCGWPVALEIPVGEDWPADGYLVILEGSHPNGPARHAHIVLIRGRAEHPAPLLLIACTGTWTAYNEWGGSNHYEGITGPKGDQFSPILSTQRPWTKGFAEQPPEAPRIPCDPPPMGQPPTYPHMRWAHANGYSKKYASSGWAHYERPFVQWLAQAGYRFDIATQGDLQFDPGILDRYRAAVIVGHDEYWSWEMRDTLDAWLDAGGRLARFAGNFYWQIRLEDEGRRQVCYKYRAPEEDPLSGTERMTHVWESVGRPGAATMGLSGAFGIYSGWAGCVARGAGGFTIYRPDHWAFAGTGLGYGDVLGAGARIFGYEVDGVDYETRGGLPHPVDADNLEILAMAPATTVETSPEPEPFIGLNDARAVARALHGADTDEAIDKVARGAGMIAHYRRGEGEVLNAASCNWVSGLIAREPLVERVTRNVLDHAMTTTVGNTEAVGLYEHLGNGRNEITPAKNL
ncbi:MAG: hypothetical protein OEN23_15150 [Paracoccaceae bacterium]|nr:hypothetical protein [Paracoccaceae bacterium]